MTRIAGHNISASLYCGKTDRRMVSKLLEDEVKNRVTAPVRYRS